MAYSVPTFNLVAKVWSGTLPPPNPPRIPALICQLRYPGKGSTAQDAANDWVFSPTILVPARSDLRDRFTLTGEDLVELPAGTGRMYRVVVVDDVARGFTNEYRFAMLFKWGAWPTPIP